MSQVSALMPKLSINQATLIYVPTAWTEFYSNAGDWRVFRHDSITDKHQREIFAEWVLGRRERWSPINGLHTTSESEKFNNEKTWQKVEV